jgi:hypothetical protein
MNAPDVDQVVSEVRAIAALIGLADPLAVLDRLRPLIGHYAEIAVSPGAVELIVGGPPETLAATALEFGMGPRAVATFSDCARTFRPSAVGFKVGCGAGCPSLYARLLAPLDQGLAFLSAYTPITALAQAFAGRKILYGLGFRGDPLVIKTYALDGHGFVSWRADASGLLPERKDYRADQELAEEQGRWGTIVKGLQALGFSSASHASWRSDRHAGHQPKLYFERIAPITTDWSAR